MDRSCCQTVSTCCTRWATGPEPERWNKAKIVVQPIDSGAPRTLIEGGTDARYLPTGHLVFGVEGRVVASAFDLRELKITGNREPLVHEVRLSGGASTGTVHFSVSDNGTLIYLPGVAPAALLSGELALTDRKATSNGSSFRPDGTCGRVFRLTANEPRSRSEMVRQSTSIRTSCPARATCSAGHTEATIGFQFGQPMTDESRFSRIAAEIWGSG
jgi:hypothetical protein